MYINFYVRRTPRKTSQKLNTIKMRSFFKDYLISCASFRKKQIAPQISPSPSPSPSPAPSSPRPDLNQAPSTPQKASYESEPVTPVKLTRNSSQKSEFDRFVPGQGKVNGEKLGRRDLCRAASTMEAISYRASAFAKSRAMSNNDIIRRSDFGSDSSKKMQRSTSRSYQHIIFSTSSGLLKPQHMEMKLECTLEELCFGCVKQISVSRDVISNGLLTMEEVLLTVNMEPGWKKGTVITFPGWEDEETGKISGDVVFIIVEKEHKIMKRRYNNEEDLEIEMRLPLVDALAGCNLSIPLLGEEKMVITIDEIVEPGFERVIKGQGMPRMKDSSQRGDLKIRFHLEFPKILTGLQRSEIIEILSD